MPPALVLEKQRSNTNKSTLFLSIQEQLPLGQRGASPGSAASCRIWKGKRAFGPVLPQFAFSDNTNLFFCGILTLLETQSPKAD